MKGQITNNTDVFKNLQIGHKYKYVDLCEVLGESRLQGRQKADAARACGAIACT